MLQTGGEKRIRNAWEYYEVLFIRCTVTPLTPSQGLVLRSLEHLRVQVHQIYFLNYICVSVLQPWGSRVLSAPVKYALKGLSSEICLAESGVIR
jgi:hypothetical protein